MYKNFSYAALAIIALACFSPRNAWAAAEGTTVPCYKIDIPCTCSGSGGSTVSCTASAKHEVKQTAKTKATKNCTSGRACGSRSTPVTNCKAGVPVSDPDSPNATCRRRGSTSADAGDDLDVIDDLGDDLPTPSRL